MTTLPSGTIGSSSIDNSIATVKAINDACRQRGGVYAQYSCKSVSWDDCTRGVDSNGFGISCWGPNITDTYLKSKDGRTLYTVRPDNWNEKLGTVAASEIAVVATSGGSALKPITLRDVLSSMGEHGSYAGLPTSCNLSSDTLDTKCSIRFQTTFLPVNESVFGSRSEALEFTPEAYNYQTKSNQDPKNLILLCTTQGLAVQQDEAGPARLFHHKVEASGQISRHWLEVESTRHAVGGPQVETEAEKRDALARGKATASVIGPRALGTRFNALMTIQIPLQQQQKESIYGALFCSAPSSGPGFASSPFGIQKPASMEYSYPVFIPMSRKKEKKSAPVVGTATAARLSIGSRHEGVWSGLCGNARQPVRHESQHITVTIVLYNVVMGGVPSQSDVIRAIDDLERLYEASRCVKRSQAVYANDHNTSYPTTVPSPTPQPLQGVQNFDQFPTVGDPFSQPPAYPGFGTAPSNLKFFTSFWEVPKGVQDTVGGMALSHGTFSYVHDLGLGKLNVPDASPSLLSESYGYFRLANEIHSQLTGAPSATAMYNMACVCSRLAALYGTQQTGVTPFGSSPPIGVGGSSATSEEACLNAAVQWLRASAAAGYVEYGRMQVDTDLVAVRSKRPTSFQMAIEIAQALSKSHNMAQGYS